MTEIINLRQQRKTKARVEKAKKAAENRLVHGLSKAEKQRKKQDAERAKRHLDGHKREQENE